jgi:DNA phosphorothioation-dependent restriction protein DptG
MAGVIEKLEEEMEELKEALSTGDREKAEEELGDLLFVMVNVARFLNVHPERALAKTMKKFNSRFRYMEEALRKKGKSLRQSTLAEMEAHWQEAKRWEDPESQG